MPPACRVLFLVLEDVQEEEVAKKWFAWLGGKFVLFPIPHSVAPHCHLIPLSQISLLKSKVGLDKL